MNLEQRPSGLIVPEQPKAATKPERTCEPLELTLSRDVAGRLFTSLVNLPEVSGGGIGGDHLSRTRMRMVYALAHELLGDGWECEILC